jgi:23S rRNA maturation-related 3'-5' exoribonuclease YhaM
VPIPEKIVIAALKSHLVWCTDLVADINTVQLDKIALNREDMFIKKQHILTSRSKSKIQRIVRRIITSNEGRLVSPYFKNKKINGL